MGHIPPFDPGAERWGVNRLMMLRYAGDFDAWDRWFDLHDAAHIQRERSDAWAWYQRQDCRRPIYSWSIDPLVPGHRAYPCAAVREFFGGHQDFDGSISWMIALAIMEGFTDIDLFWFTLNSDNHAAQIPNAQYWIGQAEGRGIRVSVHGEDSALKHSGRLYGLPSAA